MNSLQKSPYFALLFDESSDVTNIQQFITFVRFVENGIPKTKFLDIRNLEGNATAEKMEKTALAILDDHELQSNNFIAMSTDGAAAMQGQKTGLIVRLQKASPWLIGVNCACHRLALACGDSVDDIAYIKTVEGLLLLIWKFFADSPKRTAKLLEFQRAEVEDHTPLALQRACKTRWLSHAKAIHALRMEFIPVLNAMQFFAEGERNAVVIGIYRQIHTVKFLGTIIMLDNVLPHLNQLSLVFQSDSLNFAQVSTSLHTCISKLKKVAADHTASTALQDSWEAYSPRFGEWKFEYGESVSVMEQKYIDALQRNLGDRFPEPEILSAFQLFDPCLYPLVENDRELYGNAQLQTLIERFSHLVRSAHAKRQWSLFKDQLANPPLSDCKNAAALLKIVTTSTYYEQTFPDICVLAKIALCIPMGNAAPERGFSALKLSPEIE